MATRKLSTSSPDEVQQYSNRNVTINTLLISITLTSIYKNTMNNNTFCNMIWIFFYQILTLMAFPGTLQ